MARINGVDLPREKLDVKFSEDSIFDLTPEHTGPTLTRAEGIIGEGAACKCNDAHKIFNCVHDLSARVRCLDGTVQYEPCAGGCEVKPIGEDDVCAIVPTTGTGGAGGGFTTGGTNFDAKLRRQSLDPQDLLIGHIGAMDCCARGLKAAARMMEDKALSAPLEARYAGWESAEAKAVLSGKRSLRTAS
mgnify:CR=1 FL=1